MMPEGDEVDEARPIVHYFAALFACVFASLLLAVGLIAVAGGAWALLGSAAMDGKYGSLGSVAKSYLQGCVTGGLLIGLLNPLARWRLGVFVLAWLAAASLYLTVIDGRWGPIATWGWVEILMALILVGLVGTVGGANALRMMGPHRKVR
jgi:hypothetical protein